MAKCQANSEQASVFKSIQVGQDEDSPGPGLKPAHSSPGGKTQKRTQPGLQRARMVSAPRAQRLTQKRPVLLEARMRKRLWANLTRLSCPGGNSKRTFCKHCQLKVRAILPGWAFSNCMASTGLSLEVELTIYHSPGRADPILPSYIARSLCPSKAFSGLALEHNSSGDIFHPLGHPVLTGTNILVIRLLTYLQTG